MRFPTDGLARSWEARQVTPVVFTAVWFIHQLGLAPRQPCAGSIICASKERYNQARTKQNMLKILLVLLVMSLIGLWCPDKKHLLLRACVCMQAMKLQQQK